MKYTPEELARLTEAVEEVKALKRFVLERAIIHARVTKTQGHSLKDPHLLQKVDEQSLFDPSRRNILIRVHDGYNPERRPVEYQVPRDFVFSEPGETELKWEQYLALKAELGQ